MTAWALSPHSERNLVNIHPDLVRVIRRAASEGARFVVIEGLRSLERQKALVKAGASRTMRSRHLTGHAVDLAALVGKDIRWDWPLYDLLAERLKRAAEAEAVPLEWGGDWAFRDGPHFQLPWGRYPAAQS